jgi:uncharacterized protein YbjT (DUF2867 family)
MRILVVGASGYVGRRLVPLLAAIGSEWLAIEANDRRSAVETTRAAVAEWLGVSPDAFDVETGRTDGYPTKPTPRRP